MRAELKGVLALQDHTIYVTHDQVEAMSLATASPSCIRAHRPGRVAGRGLPHPAPLRRLLHRQPADEFYSGEEGCERQLDRRRLTLPGRNRTSRQ